MAAVPTGFSPSRTVSAVRRPSASTCETARSIAWAASSRLRDQRSKSAAAQPGQLEGPHRNPLDLGCAIAHGVDGGLTARRHIAPLGPAEIETTGQLANHQEIDVTHSLGPQGRGGNHRRIDANGAQIREEAKPLAEAEQGRARPKLAVRRGIIPFRSTHGAEEK